MTDRRKGKVRLIDRFFSLLGTPAATRHNAAVEALDNAETANAEVRDSARAFVLAARAFEASLVGSRERR